MRYFLLIVLITISWHYTRAQVWTHYPKPNTRYSSVVAVDSFFVYISFANGILRVHQSTAQIDTLLIPDDMQPCEKTVNPLEAAVSDNGTIWLLNKRGLLRYEGGNWTLFDNFPSPQLANQQSLATDRSGNVYLFGWGLSKFDGSTWTVFDSSNAPFSSDTYINELAVGGGKIAFRSPTGNICTYDQASWSVVTPGSINGAIDFLGKVTLNTNGQLTIMATDTLSITTVYQQTPNGFLIGTGYSTFMCGSPTFGFNNLRYSDRYVALDMNNLYLNNQGTCSTLILPGYIWNVVDDPYGFIWLKGDSCLWKYNATNSTLTTAFTLGRKTGAFAFYDDFWYAIQTDLQGKIWVGSFNSHTVCRYNGSDFDEFNLDSIFQLPQVRNNHVGAIAVDPLHNWVYAGLNVGLLAKYDGQIWTLDTITTPSNPSNKFISALRFDRYNNLLIGFNGADTGLVVLDTGGNTQYYSLRALGSATEDILSIAVDTAMGGNDYWIGTDGGGVILKTNAGFSHLTNPSSPLPGNTVQCIAIDQLGMKWIGTNAGLVTYDNSVWTDYTGTNSPFCGDDIEYIAFNPYDNYRPWVATDSPGGICVLQDSGWVCFTTCNSALSNNDVEAIAFDGPCSVWLPNERMNSNFSLDHLEYCGLTYATIHGNVFTPNQEAAVKKPVTFYKRTGNQFFDIGQTFTDSFGRFRFCTSTKSNDLYVASSETNNTLQTYASSSIVRQEAIQFNLMQPTSTMVIQQQKLTTTSGSCCISGNVAPNGLFNNPFTLYLVDNITKAVVAKSAIDADSTAFRFTNLPVGVYQFWADRFGIVDSLNARLTLTAAQPCYSNLLLHLLPDRLALDSQSLSATAILPLGPDRQQWSVYPIPARNNLQVLWPEAAGPTRIELLDTWGNTQISQLAEPVQGQFQIDIAHLHCGVYLLRLCGTAATVTSKIIVEGTN